jgi:cold shock CspA family protein
MSSYTASHSLYERDGAPSADVPCLRQFFEALSSLLGAFNLGEANKAHVRDDTLLHGYTISQWYEWGCKKSKIASKTSKENGALKSRILGLEAEVRERDLAGGAKYDGSDRSGAHEDPLTMEDPWADAAAKRSHRGIRGTWEALPSDAWGRIHKKFMLDGRQCLSVLPLTSPPSVREAWADCSESEFERAELDDVPGANPNQQLPAEKMDLEHSADEGVVEGAIHAEASTLISVGPTICRGKIKSFNTPGGYGFIVNESGGRDLFYHISQLLSREWAESPPARDEAVTFMIEQSRKGLVATTVRLKSGHDLLDGEKTPLDAWNEGRGDV